MKCWKLNLNGTPNLGFVSSFVGTNFLRRGLTFKNKNDFSQSQTINVFLDNVYYVRNNLLIIWIFTENAALWTVMSLFFNNNMSCKVLFCHVKRKYTV